MTLLALLFSASKISILASAPRSCPAMPTYFIDENIESPHVPCGLQLIETSLTLNAGVKEFRVALSMHTRMFDDLCTQLIHRRATTLSVR